MPDLGFSVVIPTLRRSQLLDSLLDRLAASEHVAEVLLIDNAASEQADEHAGSSEKIRVITPGTNIFVNPAWNLGVAESRSSLIALCNDDVLFDVDHVLPAVRDRLDRGAGVVGPSPACFDDTPRRATPAFRPTYELTYGFGTLMMFRRSSWAPVPDDVRIWFGDAFLFHSQRQRNYIFHGSHIETPMSVTSSSPEFREVIRRDEEAYLAVAPRGYLRRFGMEARTVGGLRYLRHHLRR